MQNANIREVKTRDKNTIGKSPTGQNKTKNAANASERAANDFWQIGTAAVLLLVGLLMAASSVSAWGPITHDAIGKHASYNDRSVYSGSVMADLYLVKFSVKDYEAGKICKTAQNRGRDRNEMKFANGWHMHAESDVIESSWQPWVRREIKLIGSDYLSFKYKNGQGYPHWCPVYLLRDASGHWSSTVLAQCTTFNGVTMAEQTALASGASCISLPGMGNICMPSYIPDMIKGDYEKKYSASVTASKNVRYKCR